MMNKTCSIGTGCSRFLPFVCLLTFLFVPTLATAQTTIFADSFDNGLLDSRWSSDWGQWASEGFNGTNNPPTLVPGNIPVPRPNDDPGKISTGVVG